MQNGILLAQNPYIIKKAISYSFDGINGTKLSIFCVMTKARGD